MQTRFVSPGSEKAGAQCRLETVTNTSTPSSSPETPAPCSRPSRHGQSDGRGPAALGENSSDAQSCLMAGALQRFTDVLTPVSKPWLVAQDHRPAGQS